MSKQTWVYKQLWKMYEELLRDRNSSSPKDNSGTIISRYAYKIDNKFALKLADFKDIKPMTILEESK